MKFRHGAASHQRLRIAAVVVTHDRPDELRQVITALRSQIRAPDHIIVFDNGGPVRASVILREHADSLEIIHSKENLGGAGGFAQGLALGLERGADWIWLLDDDAVPEPDALAGLLAVLPDLSANTGALCCGVREYGTWGRRHRRYFERWTGWEHSLGAKAYDRDRIEIDTGSFVGFLVSARAAHAVGLPDAGFFLAYDDTDYSLRLRDAGWRLWLVPGSVINHLRNRSSRLHSSRFGDKHYYNIRNRLIVKRRHARLPNLATIEGLAYAVLLWMVAEGWKDGAGWRALWRSMADGIAGRLGALGAPHPTTSAQRPSEWRFPDHPRGAVIIRTQGRRPALLAAALASVAAQAVAVTAFVVVHGDDAALASIEDILSGIHEDTRILHAADLERRRGYPLNLALERIYDAGEEFDFLFFLDDDDIVYPGFCRTMSDAMRRRNVDVVYAASNRRVSAETATPGYAPLPPICLLIENFMPINSYAIRLGAIRSARLFFDESLEVLEDWNFLHRLLAMRLRFLPLGDTLSEFRITGDGNTPDKQDQAVWDRAWDGVHDFLDQIRRQMDRSYILSAFKDFDFASRGPLTPSEVKLLQKTAEFIEEGFPAEPPGGGRPAPERSRVATQGHTT
jgi:GT2 family glycosyltransferase